MSLLSSPQTLPLLKKTSLELSSTMVKIEAKSIVSGIKSRLLFHGTLGCVIGKLISNPSERIDVLFGFSLDFLTEYVSFTPPVHQTWLKDDVRVRKLIDHKSRMLLKTLKKHQ